jgi:hypothetical protein
MAIVFELGIFLVAIGIGVWQLYDVKKAQRERIAREAAKQDIKQASDA